ncbi:MAG: outer membrane beta-barrel protein [Acidobacteriaceae bacterium]
MRYLRLLLGIISLAVFTVAAPAQITTGQISGTVADSSGAVVTGVTVTTTNDATGVITKAESSKTGEYLLNFLVPGTYHVEVEKAGFKKAVESQVIVNAGSMSRVNFSLHVGNVGQTVNVLANSISVTTETAELSEVFSHKALEKLPNLDRNPLYQMNLLPGANNGPGSGNYGTNGGEDGSAVGLSRPQLASIGGVDANANIVYIDGVANSEPQNNYLALIPPIEDIQEMSVYTGKYDAEYGFSGSAVISVATKSGTNEFHGAAFEYFRNQNTDAHNYFAVGVPNPLFHRNLFGGALGGPILKDKMFFFTDYQGTVVNTGALGFTTAPTSKMKAGDFSELLDPTQHPDDAGNTYGTIYDPFTRTFDSQGNVTSATPFPGNIIPQNRWDGPATAMNAAQIFGTANLPGISNNLQYIENVGSSTHLADGRLDYNRTSRDRIFYRYSLLKAGVTDSTNVSQFFQTGAGNNTFNQNMQLSDMFNISANKFNEFRLGFGRFNVQTNNNSMSKNWNNIFGIPNGNLTGAGAMGMAEMNMSGVSAIAQPDWVAYIVSNTYAATENFTWVKGRHLIKLGTNINHIVDVSADTIGGDNPRGAVGFSEAMTSYDGVGYNGGGNPNNALPVQPFGYPSFLLGTMTSSARAHFVSGAPYQTIWENAWYAQDDFKVLPSLVLNLGLRYELITRPIERHNREANWDTRTNKLVVATSSDRSPALSLDKNDWEPRVGFAWSPDQGKTSIRGGYGISYWMARWSGPLTILGLTYPFYAKQIFLTPNNLTPTLVLSQQGLPLAKAQYNSQGQLVIPPGALIRGVGYDWKNQWVGQSTLDVERQILPGMIIDVGYINVSTKYNNHSRNINQALPQPPGVNYNLFRPLVNQYPTLGDVPISFSEASGNYNAVTVEVTGNIKSLFINSSYAHSRNFSNGNNLNLADINQYYGPTQSDIAHIFNTEIVYGLPVGRGKPFLGGINRFGNMLIGGWQYSALLHIQSGVRFDVTTNDTTSLNNGQTNRCDRVGSGVLSHPTIQRWFDTSAFVIHTTPDTYGTCGINPLYTDGMQQLDSSLMKDFHVTKRQQAEFRWDVFNTFNHPNFAAPDSGVGDATEGQVFSTSVENRRMQFSLLYTF